MSDDARRGLAVSLETFGDLSGIVFNDRTGEIVGTHQRLERLRAAGAIEVVREGAEGYVLHPKTGERFRVRFVDWDTTKQRMANLSANNPALAGEFTEETIEQVRALEDEALFNELQLDKLVAEEEAASHEPPSLEDFDITPPSKKTWILIATSADRAPEIENALAPFADDETRIEVSGS